LASRQQPNQVPSFDLMSEGEVSAPGLEHILTVAPRPTVRRRPRPNGLGTLWRVAVDVATLVLASVITVAVGGDDLAPATLILFDAVAIALMAVFRAYTPKVRLDVLDDIRLAGASTAVAGMIVISAGPLTSSTVDANQVLVLWLFSSALLAVGRIGSTEIALRRRRTRTLGMNTLIVGAGQVGRLTARRLLEHPEFGLQPVGFLDKEPIELPDQPLPLPVLGGSSDLDGAIADYDVDCVVITFSNAPHDEYLDLLDECARLGVRALIVPRLFERVPSRLRVEHVGGLPLLEMHVTSPRGFQYAVKYTLDRMIGALLLLLLSPVLIATAVAVRLSLGRPILYRQGRVGLDGVAFRILKFRTMRPALLPEDDVQEFEPERAPGGVEGSDRRTRVGTFLRATSLDELIQLVNVVKGEMSLVGPRPERPEYVEYFAAHVHRYNDRHRVKSGITGWAQVHRLRGRTSIQDRVEWDNYYIDNFSLWLDLKILLLTLPAILRVRSD
jgi:exopolysaccharide biosynthesis polyprenyl glycosylphosphotransferase